MNVGRRGAVHHVVPVKHQLEPLEVVVHPFHDGEDSEQNRQVGLHRRGHPTLALKVDPAVQVVRQRGDHQHDDQSLERPPEQELDERKLENVKPDVLMELRILNPEAEVVSEKVPVVPLPVGPDTGEQGEDRRRSKPDPSSVRVDQVAVSNHQLVGSPRRHVERRVPVGNDQIAPQDQEEDGDEYDRE